MKRICFNIFLNLLFVLLISCSPTLPAAKTALPAQAMPLQLIPMQQPVAPESVRGNFSLKKPLQARPLIVIDAGHGGEDFGTHSLGVPKFQEKYLNMSTAIIVKNFLEQFGCTVLMTRSDDTFVPLDKRAAFANERNPKLFVSIHYNSAPSKEAEGIEVFYYRSDENKERTAKSKLLAQAISEKTVQNTKAKSRGIKHGNYAVLRETKMAAVLIEGGFLTNASEMDKIKDANYLKNIALGIAQGIQSYLAKEAVGGE